MAAVYAKLQQLSSELLSELLRRRRSSSSPSSSVAETITNKSLAIRKRRHETGDVDNSSDLSRGRPICRCYHVCYGKARTNTCEYAVGTSVCVCVLCALCALCDVADNGQGFPVHLCVRKGVRMFECACIGLCVLAETDRTARHRTVHTHTERWTPQTADTHVPRAHMRMSTPEHDDYKRTQNHTQQQARKSQYTHSHATARPTLSTPPTTTDTPPDTDSRARCCTTPLDAYNI